MQPDGANAGNAAPRMNLLNGAGSSAQAAGKTGGAYGAGSLTIGTPPASAPTPPPPVQAAAPPAPKPAPPVPAPTPRPAVNAAPPAPRQAPPPPRPKAGRSKLPLIIGIIVVLLLIAGAAVWYFFLRAKPADTTAEPKAAPVAASPVAPTQLTPLDGDSKATITSGGSTKQTKLTFNFTIPTKATSGDFIPEIEVEPIGTAFTGTPTVTGQNLTATGGDLSASLQLTTALAEGKYHWQARDSVGDQHGDWTPASSDATKPDFVVDTTVPSAPVITSIGGSPFKAGAAVTTQNAKPVFTGTTEPNAKIAITIDSAGTPLAATADATGAWTVTPSANLTPATHTLSIVATDPAGNASQAVSANLTISPTATAPAPTPPAPAPAPTPPPAPAPAPAPLPAKLADTGDNTYLPTAAASAMLLLSLGGLMVVRRRERRTD